MVKSMSSMKAPKAAANSKGKGRGRGGQSMTAANSKPKAAGKRFPGKSPVTDKPTLTQTQPEESLPTVSETGAEPKASALVDGGVNAPEPSECSRAGASPKKKAKTTAEAMRGDLLESELPTALVPDSDAEDPSDDASQGDGSELGLEPTDDPEVEGKPRAACIGCNKMKYIEKSQKFPTHKGGSSKYVYRCNSCNSAKGRIVSWLGKRASREEISAYNNLGAVGKKEFAARCHNIMGTQMPMALWAYIEQKKENEKTQAIKEEGEMVSSETLENHNKDLLFNRSLKYVYIYIYIYI